MTVTELIKQLQQIPPDAVVITFDAYAQSFKKVGSVEFLDGAPVWSASFPGVGDVGAVCIV